MLGHHVRQALIARMPRGDFVQSKTGKRYNNEYCFLFRFRGDKIAEVVEYCDTDLKERVLGPYDDAVGQMEAAR